MTEVHIADTDDKIAACFPVMHELRPHLTDAADLVARVRRMQKQGFELAYVEEEGRPVACMGFRDCEMLHRNQSFYVDDLVTLPDVRSRAMAPSCSTGWKRARNARARATSISTAARSASTRTASTCGSVS